MSELPPSIESVVPARQPSLGARMLNVFAAPSETFDAIKGKEPAHSNWLAPALMLLMVSWLGSWLVFSQDALRHQIREATEKATEQRIAAQHMSEAQAEEARQAAEKFAGIFQTVGIVAGPILIAFVPPFFLGLLFWVIAQYAWKTPLAYMKAVEVVGLAGMISVLEVIVRTLLILITGNLAASLSPVLLIKEFDPAKALHSLAILVNPLVFWMLAVRAIGLARVTGSSLGKSACWVFGLWCGYTGFFWGLGWAGQQLAKKMGGQ